MTATEAAKHLGVSKGRISQLIREGRLPAALVETSRGPVYEITEEDIAALRKVWPKDQGRPLEKQPRTPYSIRMAEMRKAMARMVTPLKEHDD